ncbi:MAG: hypothetical protein M1830_009936, partial [Pleopsidium flavum]
MKGTTKLKRPPSARDGSLSPPPLKRKFESTTTKSAIASFFTPVSQKEPDKTTWRVINNSLLIGRYRLDDKDRREQPPTKRRRIAGFDFDSTLIRSASGNKFGKDATDWRWWHASVPGRLRALYADGYQVVILSNQGGISLKSDPKSVKSDQKRLAEFKDKVTSVFNQLSLPISIYAATARDQYRKPRTGMWSEMVEDHDLEVTEGLDLQGSVFVGDAGGRSSGEGHGNDHSCSDRDFATNVGIAFKTPEEYFLDQTPRPYTRHFDPPTYFDGTNSKSADTTPVLFTKNNIPDLVLLCGSPGAGKSTFYWNHLGPLGYERVNQDQLKTRDRCVQLASQYISEGKAVAVDNTNADIETRGKWIQLARKLGVPIRCVYLTASPKLCEHNDTVRALNGTLMNPEQR